MGVATRIKIGGVLLLVSNDQFGHSVPTKRQLAPDYYIALKTKIANLVKTACAKNGLVWPKNHVWHGFTLILAVLIDFLCQKT